MSDEDIFDEIHRQIYYFLSIGHQQADISVYIREDTYRRLLSRTTSVMNSSDDKDRMFGISLFRVSSPNHHPFSVVIAK